MSKKKKKKKKKVSQGHPKANAFLCVCVMGLLSAWRLEGLCILVVGGSAAGLLSGEQGAGGGAS